MYHEVKWNEELLNNFIKYGELNEREAKLLAMRTKEATITEIAKTLDVSERTINRKLGEMKLLYDRLSANNNTMFPPRKVKTNFLAELDKYSGKVFFVVDGDEDNIHVIELENKTFKSSKEMINYIYSQVCTICNKSLAEINEIRFTYNLTYTVKFTK